MRRQRLGGWLYDVYGIPNTITLGGGIGTGTVLIVGSLLFFAAYMVIVHGRR